jgi:hypothetical protein
MARFSAEDREDDLGYAGGGCARQAHRQTSGPAELVIAEPPTLLSLSQTRRSYPPTAGSDDSSRRRSGMLTSPECESRESRLC